MKKLMSVHAIDMILLTVGELISFAVIFCIQNCFDTPLPSFAMAVLVLIWPLIGALVRFDVWRRRCSLLTKEELEQFSVKVFFMMMVIEIGFVVIGGTIIVTG